MNLISFPISPMPRSIQIVKTYENSFVVKVYFRDWKFIKYSWESDFVQFEIVIGDPFKSPGLCTQEQSSRLSLNDVGALECIDWWLKIWRWDLFFAPFFVLFRGTPKAKAHLIQFPRLRAWSKLSFAFCHAIFFLCIHKHIITMELKGRENKL